RLIAVRGRVVPPRLDPAFEIVPRLDRDRDVPRPLAVVLVDLAEDAPRVQGVGAVARARGRQGRPLETVAEIAPVGLVLARNVEGAEPVEGRLLEDVHA